jgi:hypothetical protein
VRETVCGAFMCCVRGSCATRVCVESTTVKVVVYGLPLSSSLFRGVAVLVAKVGVWCVLLAGACALWFFPLVFVHVWLLVLMVVSLGAGCSNSCLVLGG